MVDLSHQHVDPSDEPQPIEATDSTDIVGAKVSIFKRHKKLFIVLWIVLAIVIIGGGTVGALMLTQHPKQPAKPVVKVTKPVVPPAALVYYSPLTGEKVANKSDITAPVTAVMIENSPDARPQSGLKDSDVVFEAIAEGGITRFMVLYQQAKPQLIGPVRSLRIYDIDWMAPFNASIAHVGGSAAALAEIRNGQWRDIDQFFNSNYYWRSTDRYAPHNVYTSSDKLAALNQAKGFTSSSVVGFSRKDSAPAKNPTATKINVTISSSLYNSSYSYNASTNTYDRSQAGAPHLDRESGQISPRVVVVMSVQEQTVMQDGYRQQITTIGSGPAWIFQDGTEQTVTWHKISQAAQITFTDSAGNDIALARGQTWITAVPGNEGGSVSWQ